MMAIVCKEILATKGVDAGKISIDTDHAGMYPAMCSLVAINGKTMVEMAKDGSLSKMGTDLDKGAMHSNHSMCIRTTLLNTPERPWELFTHYLVSK